MDYVPFQTMGPVGKNTGLCSNTGGLSSKELDSDKPLRYYTTSFYQIGDNFTRGIMNDSDYGAPGTTVDIGTKIRDSSITKDRYRHGRGQLPMSTTASYLNAQGDTYIEDMNLRNGPLRAKNSCQPRDNKFYERSFYIFDGMPYVPNQDPDTFAQRCPSYRQGIDTRQNYSQA